MTRAPLPLAPVLMYLRKSHIIAYLVATFLCNAYDDCLALPLYQRAGRTCRT